MTSHLQYFIILVLLIVSSLACQSGQNNEHHPIPDLTLISENKGNPAGSFILESLNGEEVSLKGLRGKVVFLTFWLSSCEACLEEMPSIERLYNKLKDKDFMVLAVNLGEEKDRVEQYARILGVSFPILMDSSGSVAKTYSIEPIPVTYIIDKHGTILGKAVGRRQWDSPKSVRYFNWLCQQ
mgnify:CR=1 FL=1